RTPRRTAGRSARTATWSAPRPPGGARPRCAPPGKRTPLSRRRTAAAAACGSRVVRDRDRGAVAGGDVRVLDDARHPPDVLEKGSRGRAGIAAVERRHESLEQAGEPPMIRRFFELRRVIEPFHLARALQPQLTTRPLDRALVAHQPNPVLPATRAGSAVVR